MNLIKKNKKMKNLLFQVYLLFRLNGILMNNNQH